MDIMSERRIILLEGKNKENNLIFNKLFEIKRESGLSMNYIGIKLISEILLKNNNIKFGGLIINNKEDK